VLALRLRQGEDGDARIMLEGKGRGLGLPALPLDPPVTVQLVRSDDQPCWDARFEAARKTTRSRFKAISIERRRRRSRTFRRPHRCASIADVVNTPNDPPAKPPEGPRQRGSAATLVDHLPRRHGGQLAAHACARPGAEFRQHPLHALQRSRCRAGNVEEVTSQGDAIQGAFKKEVTYPSEGPDAHRAALQDVAARLANPGLETSSRRKGVVINARPLDEGETGSGRASFSASVPPSS
jgi:hypothetical protein